MDSFGLATERPYQIPPGFSSAHVSPAELAMMAKILCYSTSLPAVLPGCIDLVMGAHEAYRTKVALVLQELRIAEARLSPAAFVEYALANATNGDRLKNGSHHLEWHKHFDDNQYAILFAPVEHAKTTHMAVGRMIWLLGDNPNRRLAIISNTASQAEDTLASIRTHIETNPRVHEVFPHLRRSSNQADPWHSRMITVERSSRGRDPSIRALGVAGPLVGARLDVALLDDVLDMENTRSQEQMDKLLEWYETTLMTRIVDGGCIHIIGTPWAPGDLLHKLEARSNFVTKRYSAVLNPEEPQDRWIPLWPEQFSVKRLRAIWTGTTPANFARKYLCVVTSAESARFRVEWIRAAQDAGAAFKRFPLAPLVNVGSRLQLPSFTGVDLGVGTKGSSDLTVLFTIAVDERERRIPMEIQSGRWTAPEILSRLQATQKRYGSKLVVESNGAQSFLIQWALDIGVPCEPFATTSRNKYDERFGIESLAVEMRNGLWVIPSGAASHPEIDAWIQEMLTYQPDAHTGDRLMASWFAREAARRTLRGIQRQMDTLSR